MRTGGGWSAFALALAAASLAAQPVGRGGYQNGPSNPNDPYNGSAGYGNGNGQTNGYGDESGQYGNGYGNPANGQRQSNNGQYGYQPYGTVQNWQSRGTTWFSQSYPQGAKRFSKGRSGGDSLWEFGFTNAARPLGVIPNAVLYCWVKLDPTNPPKEIMVAWNDGSSWEHRAYWGADTITYGQDHSPSRLSAGALPPTGQWVELTVPANAVGLAGKTVSGMSFSMVGGQADFGAVGMEPGQGQARAGYQTESQAGFGNGGAQQPGAQNGYPNQSGNQGGYLYRGQSSGNYQPGGASQPQAGNPVGPGGYQPQGTYQPQNQPNGSGPPGGDSEPAGGYR